MKNYGTPEMLKLLREAVNIGAHKELEKVRRMLVEYGLSRWDMTYILPADKELHDRIKKIENA